MCIRDRQAAASAASVNDSDTTYTAGTGLTLTGTEFSVTNPFTDADETKLDGIEAGADVTPSWVPDTDPGYLTEDSDTTYTAGTGLNLSGTEFSVDTTTIATRDYVDNNDADTTYTEGYGINIASEVVSVDTDDIATVDYVDNSVRQEFFGPDSERVSTYSGTASGLTTVGGNTVTGDSDVVLGIDNTVSGNNSVIVGNGITSSDDQGVNVGIDSRNSGEASVAIGDQAAARTNESIAIGHNSTAGTTAALRDTDDSAVNTGVEVDAIAIGTNTVASAMDSLAIGAGSTSSHTNSTAIGAGAETNFNHEIRLGDSDAFVTVFDADATHVTLDNQLTNKAYVDDRTGIRITDFTDTELTLDSDGTTHTFSGGGGDSGTAWYGGAADSESTVTNGGNALVSPGGNTVTADSETSSFIAVGQNNELTGSNIGVFGRNNTLDGVGISAVGALNTVWTDTDAITPAEFLALSRGIIVIGAANTIGDSDDRSPNGMAVGINNTLDSGNRTVLFGLSNTAVGDNALTVGIDNDTHGARAIAYGEQNTIYTDTDVATGEAIAIGYDNDVGVNDTDTVESTVVVGLSNFATGSDSTIVGSDNASTGQYGIVFSHGNEIYPVQTPVSYTHLTLPTIDSV